MSSISLNGFLSTALSGNIQDLRTQIADRAKEATTGLQADLVKHLDGQIDRALLADLAVKENADDRDRLELRQIRLSIVQTSVSAIHDLTEGYQLDMRAAIGVPDVQRQTTVARQAEEAISEVLSRLNARNGERFLFSGDATATAPFLDADTLLNDVRAIATAATDEADFAAQVQTYFQDPTGGFQTSFYQGADTASDPDAVLANQSAFADLFQGLSMLALAGPGEGVPFAQAGTAALDEALDLLERGRTGLVNIEADVGIRQASLSSEQELLEREATLLTNAFGELAGKDQYEAATQLEQLETNLEASYLLTTRLSNLTLLNFLR
ncbi:MAG: flagellin [Pseudomonadota bacterium]